MTDDERKAQNEAGDYVFPQDLPDPAFPNGLRREGGLTLRDYFAAQALTQCIVITYGALRNGFEAPLDALHSLSAEGAYRFADAMLSERAKCAK